jgi:hypothetical protein
MYGFTSWTQGCAATGAVLAAISGVALDTAGNIYVVDMDNVHVQRGWHRVAIICDPNRQMQFISIIYRIFIMAEESCFDRVKKSPDTRDYAFFVGANITWTL